MEDEFELPVMFNNEQLSFPAKLLQYGYSYKLEITIKGIKLLFEPDEERNWRALVSEKDLNDNKAITVQLLKAVVGAIETILK